jgi:hypothetical protein
MTVLLLALLSLQDDAATKALEHLKAELPKVMNIERIFAGYAFLAEGSTPAEGKYSAELNTCIKAAMGGNNGDWRENWYWGFGGLFLAEIQKRWPSDDKEAALKDILKKIVANQEESGGWCHKKGFVYNLGSKKIPDVLAVSSIVFAALGNMKAAGIDVPQATLDRALAYFQKMGDGSGGFAYGTNNGVPDPGATRGAAVLIGLSLMGSQSGPYGSIAQGVKSRVAGVARGHAFPAFHFFTSAVGNYLAGSFSAFKGAWTDKLVGQMEADGGIWLKNHEGIDYERTRMNNNVMGTSVLAVILLIEKGNLFKSKKASTPGKPKSSSSSPFSQKK